MDVRLCECGCGQPTPIASQNHTKYGWVKGEPKRFVTGHHIRTPKTLEQAFMEHFVPGAPGECWEWQGPIANTRYGRVSVDSGRMLAHRASYLIHYGSLPDDMEVCHRCDNRPCVNPEHLFLGTHQENVRDAAVKGRMPRKLTVASVREIRRLVEQGHKQNAVAAIYGVSAAVVNKIVLRTAWKHVE